MPRRYGQHFLKDENILRRIVEGSGVGMDDAVLEIGPGAGALTRVLSNACRKVLAVELDRRLAEQLKDRGVPPNVELRQGDALELSDQELLEVLGERYHLVSNLPYEITSATLQRFLSRPLRPVSITLLIQKEVAERIIAKDTQSRLSIFCGYHALSKVLFTVSPGAFDPPPKVMSAVIHLALRQKPLLEPAFERRLFTLTEKAFAEKRKTLANSLRSVLGSEAAAKLKGIGIAPTARPEEICLEQWMEMARLV